MKVQAGALRLRGGDRVLIGISERVLLSSALTLYLLPLLFLLVSAIAGYRLAVMLNALQPAANLLSILAGGAGFYLGFRLARRRAQRLTTSAETGPVILRRL